MEFTQVQGKDRGDVILYALSTCGWCRKTKELLKKMGVAYRYIDVDLLPAGERDEVMKLISKMNPTGNFPTIIINDDTCIVGFQEKEIKEALGK